MSAQSKCFVAGSKSRVNPGGAALAPQLSFVARMMKRLLRLTQVPREMHLQCRPAQCVCIVADSVGIAPAFTKLALPAAEQFARHHAPRYGRGYGWMFSQHIQQANLGCDFDFLRTDFGAPVPEPDIF